MDSTSCGMFLISAICEDEALWELERAVVRAVACEVERRLADDPEASLIWDTVGAGNQAITTGSADRENPNALLFDEYILKDNANFRVPYSIHPATGLGRRPSQPVPIGHVSPGGRVAGSRCRGLAQRTPAATFGR